MFGKFTAGKTYCYSQNEINCCCYYNLMIVLAHNPHIHSVDWVIQSNVAINKLNFIKISDGRGRKRKRRIGLVMDFFGSQIISTLIVLKMHWNLPNTFDVPRDIFTIFPLFVNRPYLRNSSNENIEILCEFRILIPNSNQCVGGWKCKPFSHCIYLLHTVSNIFGGHLYFMIISSLLQLTIINAHMSCAFFSYNIK